MAGYKSLFAFWSGGASAVSAPATTGGRRSMLAPWIGGAAASPSSTKGGYRSMLAFWAGGGMGGISGVPIATIPAPIPASGYSSRQEVDHKQLRMRAQQIEEDEIMLLIITESFAKGGLQ